MTLRQIVSLNPLDRFPLDILIYVFQHLSLVCHGLPLHLYGLPSIRL